MDNRYTVVFPHKEGAYAETYYVVYFHSGSLIHPLGNPIAAGSTTGYFTSKALMSLVKVLAGLMLLSQ